MPGFLFGTGLVFIIDRFSKVLALKTLSSVSTFPVWPGVFHWTLVRNTGVAFGMFQNKGAFLAVLSLFSAAAILFYLCFTRSRAGGKQEMLRRWAWAVIAGGALGNAYDRIRFGAVIDFLDFRIWPVFNLADTAIICGALTVALTLFFQKEAP